MYPESDPERTRAYPPAEVARENVVAREDVVEREDRIAGRVRTVRAVNSFITFVCGLFAVVLVTQIILVLADANPANGFASFVADFSDGVDLGFDNLFTPSSDKLAVLLNYGAAAIVWLLIGAALTYLIRRMALPARRPII